MCGIVGVYANKTRNLIPETLTALKKLDYRGYDSVGIAVSNKDLEVSLFKKTGDVQSLIDNLIATEIEAKISISHTRWATHGKVNSSNAHPHRYKDVFIVHNGVIENYTELKRYLSKKGIRTHTDTDSEIIACLIYHEFQNINIVEEAFAKAISKLKGSYAILATIAGLDFIGIAKQNSPLVLAKNSKNDYIATSDVLALPRETYNIYDLIDGDVITISHDQLSYNHSEVKFSEAIEVKENQADGILSRYETFMEKEIYEQPEILARTINHHINFDKNKIFFPEIENLNIHDIKNIVFIGCGSSYYAAYSTEVFFQKYAKVRTFFEVASEFRYKNFPVDQKRDLYILISQSGETADVIEVAKLLKEKKCKTIGLVNASKSTLTKLTDYTINIDAGVEISVAATKSVSSQIMNLILLAIRFARKKVLISSEEQNEIITQIQSTPRAVKSVIEYTFKNVKDVTEHTKVAKHIMYIGRNNYYAIALESALKMKEISNITSEALPSGELKHGSISLACEDLLVIANIPKDDLFFKNVLSVESLIARNANVILITSDDAEKSIDVNIKKKLKTIINLKNNSEFVLPFLFLTINQITAYKTAQALKKNVDKPRNLAKSVTVE